MKRFTFDYVNPFDDRVFCYCDVCEAKIPPDEYDENGLCEVCQRRKVK